MGCISFAVVLRRSQGEMEISNYTAVRAPIVQPAGLEARHGRISKSSAWFFLAALLVSTAMFFTGPSLLAARAGNPADASSSPSIRIQGFDVEKQKVTVTDATGHQPVSIAKGENFGPWTLMAVIDEPEGSLAVFEELTDRRGSIIYVGKQGVVLNLPKSLEPTSAAPSTLYGGRTQEEIAKSQNDILGQELLAGTADPDYGAVAAALPRCGCPVLSEPGSPTTNPPSPSAPSATRFTSTWASSLQESGKPGQRMMFGKDWSGAGFR
jgi:hypothetical protein